MKFQVVDQNALAIPFFLLISFMFNLYAAYAQGYAGTGVSRESLEAICKSAVQTGTLQGRSTTEIVNIILRGRLSINQIRENNNANQEYRNQINWFRNNCPSY
jgi:hypothetical protein